MATPIVKLPIDLTFGEPVDSPTRQPTTGVPPVSVLRELLRNLRLFRSLYESDGVDTLTGPDGESYCLWDVEYLYEQVRRLPPRQQEAIQLCLIDNIREHDASLIMGVSTGTPVGKYATTGLNKLSGWMRDGTLRRFRVVANEDGAR